MKKILSLLFLFVIMLYACNNAPGDSEQQAENPAEINLDNVVLIDMDINGMTCTGCENTIKSGVSELQGVVSVEASYVDGKTFVKADTNIVTLSKISETIASRGYKVAGSSIMKEGDNADEDPGEITE